MDRAAREAEIDAYLATFTRAIDGLTEWVRCERCEGIGHRRNKSGRLRSKLCGTCAGRGEVAKRLPRIPAEALALSEDERVRELVAWRRSWDRWAKLLEKHDPVPPGPRRPCTYKPRSEMKICVLWDLENRGLSLFHPEERPRLIVVKEDDKPVFVKPVRKEDEPFTWDDQDRAVLAAVKETIKRLAEGSA